MKTRKNLKCSPCFLLSLISVFFISPSSASALDIKLSLPAIISDNMVLQAGKTVPIWGNTTPGEEIEILFCGKKFRTSSDKDGKWVVKIGPLKSGGPYEMVVKDSKSSITIKNILIGEVWVCSGQSNMALILKGTLNAEQEAAKATDSKIRFFQTPKIPAIKPLYDCKGKWVVCSPKEAAEFSATGYYFGKELRKELNVPVGLIQSAYGGSGVGSWYSREALSVEPSLKHRIKTLDEATEIVLSSPNKLDIDDSNWMQTSVDETTWKTIQLPLYWDHEQYPIVYDGVIWARKTVDIPESWIGKELLVSLGKIDDYETTYFNGIQVGSTSSFNLKPRRYKIPPNLVKTGKAVIAVKTFKEDWGGIAGLKENMYLATYENQEEKVSLAGEWKYKASKLDFKHISYRVKTSLYNGMIAPLIPYGIKGVIWYQGEANATPGAAFNYRSTFPAMIKEWRSQWQQGDVPFYFVQLPNYKAHFKEDWVILRESQMKTLVVPETGMAVTVDIGDAKNIHPKNKHDVGKRLALWALAKTYGKKIEYSGPLYKGMKIEGSKIRLSFTNTTGGLVAKNGKLKTFEIAGANNKFVPAEAIIDGNTVIVYSSQIKAPVAARYAWNDTPEGCNLYNGSGLPASPFRSTK
jgi:sialate O-acetylesterase